MIEKIFLKDPAAVLDFVFDWKALTNGNGLTDWLASSETISSKVVTPDSGITVDSSTIINADTQVRVFLSGGSANNDYKVACKIVTSSGRTDERTIKIQVRDR